VSYSSRGSICRRDADTCVSVRVLEIGAGGETQRATLPYVRLLRIAPWLQLLARSMGALMAVLISDELLSLCDLDL